MGHYDWNTHSWVEDNSQEYVSPPSSTDKGTPLQIPANSGLDVNSAYVPLRTNFNAPTKQSFAGYSDLNKQRQRNLYQAAQKLGIDVSQYGTEDAFADGYYGNKSMSLAKAVQTALNDKLYNKTSYGPIKVDGYWGDQSQIGLNTLLEDLKASTESSITPQTTQQSTTPTTSPEDFYHNRIVDVNQRRKDYNNTAENTIGGAFAHFNRLGRSSWQDNNRYNILINELSKASPQLADYLKATYYKNGNWDVNAWRDAYGRNFGRHNYRDLLRQANLYNTSKLRNGGMINYYQQGGQAEQDPTQQIVALVQAAMRGDKQATQQLQQIQKAAEQGDKQAMQIMQVVQQVMQEMQQQTRSARQGAKLQYLASLRGECPQGTHMEYFKAGGQICKKCMQNKVQEDKCGGKAKKQKMACGGATKAINSIKSEMEKCGGKVKKKEITKAQSGKKLPKAESIKDRYTGGTYTIQEGQRENLGLTSRLVPYGTNKYFYPMKITTVTGPKKFGYVPAKFQEIIIDANSRNQKFGTAPEYYQNDTTYLETPEHLKFITPVTRKASNDGINPDYQALKNRFSRIKRNK